MRRSLIALSLVAVTVLGGCAASTDPGDKQACEIWSKAEQAMVQTVAIIVEKAKDPAGLSEDVATEFNTKRNQLLTAYDEAKKVATSPDLVSALGVGLDKDAAVYYDLAGATNERIQESMKAVGTLVATCTTAGIDVSGVLGTK